ncbi:LysR family transcriptional regulator [Acholeplasma hippikon]|uniref:CysJI operon transcriptional activator n=1 Tax=Acholeplasma hippikon TaxID=264636 RepID=A0A449BLF3_9MOLU|nr:LysR family transcriptional regulator [Acholeplasma hippikon]VEU83265.1 CysJI operon transcriptional activator [Acholeplasma hippikon]
MNFKLKTLIAVVDYGSFTKAAEQLALTQPAVSQQIKSLEEEFNITIFDKRKKKLELTPEGVLLVRYAKRIELLTDNMINSFKLMKKNIQIKNSLVIGITHTLESNIIAKAIAEYTAENDAFHIRIISDSIKSIYQKMKTYEVDVCIIPGKINDPNYSFIPLDQDSLAIAVSYDNPLSNKEVLSLEELKTERLILRSKTSDTRLLFESHLNTQNDDITNYNVILELDNVEVIKDLVKDNYGLSVLSRKSCISEVKKNKFKLLDVENMVMNRQINLYFHKDFTYVKELKRIINIYNELILK